jgi:hypothetical protein
LTTPTIGLDAANKILYKLQTGEIECYRCPHVVDVDLLVHAALPRRIPFQVTYEGTQRLPVYVFRLLKDA